MAKVVFTVLSDGNITVNDITLFDSMVTPLANVRNYVHSLVDGKLNDFIDNPDSPERTITVSSDWTPEFEKAVNVCYTANDKDVIPMVVYTTSAGALVFLTKVDGQITRVYAENGDVLFDTPEAVLEYIDLAAKVKAEGDSSKLPTNKVYYSFNSHGYIGDNYYSINVTKDNDSYYINNLKVTEDVYTKALEMLSTAEEPVLAIKDVLTMPELGKCLKNETKEETSQKPSTSEARDTKCDGACQVSMADVEEAVKDFLNNIVDTKEFAKVKELCSTGMDAASDVTDKICKEVTPIIKGILEKVKKHQ